MLSDEAVDILAMAAKRFTVEESEPINRVKFSDLIFLRLFN